jgi:ABC-type transport system substrate-binding protein
MSRTNHRRIFRPAYLRAIHIKIGPFQQCIGSKVHRPDSFKPVPDLAAGAPNISADAKTVTVMLKRGVHFSPPVNREVPPRARRDHEHRRHDPASARTGAV